MTTDAGTNIASSSVIAVEAVEADTKAGDWVGLAVGKGNPLERV